MTGDDDMGIIQGAPRREPQLAIPTQAGGVGGSRASNTRVSSFLQTNPAGQLVEGERAS